MSGLSFGSVRADSIWACCRRGMQHGVLELVDDRVSCVSGSASGQLGTSSVTVGAVAGTGLSVYSFDGPVVCIAMREQSHRAGGAL